MRLKQLEIAGFKSFARKSTFEFSEPISAIVGPNGSGKSNIAESIRFVLGEQSMKSLRGKRGEDLIFNGSKQSSRANRARVTIVFDNSTHELNVDFDEVAIAREVSREGTNIYMINGSHVRLRDIYELLAGASIGASSHHIISQGEADRILNAPPKERKSLIEEALGLKIYQWKIGESEKKLLKTEENIRQAESLRREIAPHITYLKKQVDKIERTKKMREELKDLYHEYLKREDTYIKKQTGVLASQKEAPEREILGIDRSLSNIAAALVHEGEFVDHKNEQQLGSVRNELRRIRAGKDELSRKIGRIEGLIEYKESTGGEEGHVNASINAEELGKFLKEIEEVSKKAEKADDINSLKTILGGFVDMVSKFRNRIFGAKEDMVSKENELSRLKYEREQVYNTFVSLEQDEQKYIENERSILKIIEEEQNKLRKSEREMYELKSRRTEILSEMNLIKSREERLSRDKRDFDEELHEALVLIGEQIKEYESFDINEAEAIAEPRQSQEDRRKRIERIKIRLEDMGGGSGEEVIREYDELFKRDEFLEREIRDLKQSADKLTDLIKELREKIDKEFKEGIKKINAGFQEFFALMFGGGSGELDIVREQKRRRKIKDEEFMLAIDNQTEETEDVEEEIEEGIDVRVTMPHKRIKGLMMLSGGERALTSIALLFAITQVNPPPFIVLDETDAALDEANSRKYGDMLENLAKYSQLIVITHNRETMSRADILYGVTMGSDATSKTLSVKFEQAAQIAAR